MTMTIPPFVNLEHDAAARKAVVSVEDKEVRNQREMWGMHPSKSISWFHRTKDLRHDSSISTKPYSRSLGRPYCHSSISWCRIQSDSREYGYHGVSRI